MLPHVSLPSRVQWRRRGFWAKFTKEHEADFKRYYEAELVPRARWSAFIAASIMMFYSVLDIFMLPDEVLLSSLVIRWCFMIIPLFIMAGASYSEWGARNLQVISAIGSTSSGLAVVAMIVVARLKGTPIDYEGIILTTFYFYCCGGLRIHWSIVAGGLASVAYPIAEFYAGLNPDTVVVRILFLFSTNVVGIAAAMLMEAAARKNFAQLVELDVIALSDPLTRVHNRRALDQTFQSLQSFSSSKAVRLHIALMDVDYFKQYNDLYGHPRGDEALMSVARVLQKHTNGKYSLTARYGGEEFICIWWEEVDLNKTSQAILDEINALAIPHLGSSHQRLTVSMGSVSFELTEANNTPVFVRSMLKKADELLYKAKSRGRNQFIAYNTSCA